jgi:hypothetical protein
VQLAEMAPLLAESLGLIVDDEQPPRPGQ